MWNVRNFARNDGNILNPRLSNLNTDDCTIQRNEFPLLQWSIAQAQKVLGEEPLVFRMFLFALGCIGVIGMFFIIRFIHSNDYIALLTSALFLFSPLYYYYSLTPSPDLLALVAAIWYIYFHLRYAEERKYRHLLMTTICLCIASLVKLPFLMFGIISALYYFKNIRNRGISEHANITYLITHLIVLIPFFSWYGWVMQSWEANGVLFGVFKNPVGWERTQEIFLYYFEIMIPKILVTPMSLIIVLLGIVTYNSRKSFKYHYFFLGLIAVTMLYWILEYNMIDVVHDYYLLPLLPWIYYLSSWGIKWVLDKKSHILHVLLIAMFAISSMFCHTTIIKNWSLERTYNNLDLFIYRDELKQAVPNNELCVIVNDGTGQIFSYQIDKLGYVFEKDELPLHWIHDMVLNKGVKYMYSDSEIINEAAENGGYIANLIIKKGSISVFELNLPEVR